MPIQDVVPGSAQSPSPAAATGSLESAELVVTSSSTDTLPSAERWEWQQLANACSARFGQDSVLWTIIGSFWSTNAVLLVALGASGTWANDPTLRGVICGTGVAVSLLWLFMQAAALRRVVAYEDVIKHLEAQLKLSNEARLLPGDPEDASHFRRGRLLFPARTMMPLVPPLSVAAWLVGLYLAVR